MKTIDIKCISTADFVAINKQNEYDKSIRDMFDCDFFDLLVSKLSNLDFTILHYIILDTVNVKLDMSLYREVSLLSLFYQTEYKNIQDIISRFESLKSIGLFTSSFMPDIPHRGYKSYRVILSKGLIIPLLKLNRIPNYKYKKDLKISQETVRLFLSQL